MGWIWPAPWILRAYWLPYVSPFYIPPYMPPEMERRLLEDRAAFLERQKALIDDELGRIRERLAKLKEAEKS